MTDGMDKWDDQFWIWSELTHELPWHRVAEENNIQGAVV